MTIPYTKNTTWADGSGGATPITAAKLNNVETGVSDAHLMPAVRAFHNAAQSITTSTTTVLAFNSERFDVAGGVASTMHDTVTNNSRLTCRHAGKFLVVANVEWGGLVGGVRRISIRLNGTTVIGETAALTVGTSARTTTNVTTIYDFAVNDYVEVTVFQDSGSTASVTVTGNFSPEFMMARVG